MAREMTAWDHMTKRGGFLDTKLGKGWRAPFTGYSWKVFRAYIHLVDAWYESDTSNRPHVETGLREILATMQQSEWPAARMVIYGIGYEGAMLDLWPRIKPSPVAVGVGTEDREYDSVREGGEA